MSQLRSEDGRDDDTMRKLSRNHKFLIILGSCILFWAILLCILIGCHQEPQEASQTMKGEGALVEIGRGRIGGTCAYIVVYDIDTGVEYYIINGHMTPRYDYGEDFKIH